MIGYIEKLMGYQSDRNQQILDLPTAGYCDKMI